MFDSQLGHMDSEWYKRIRDKGEPLFKITRDNMRDENWRTLPKTNECDRRNQPLPGNVIGCHVGTFKRHEYNGQ